MREEPNRRDFLKKSSAAGLAFLAACDSKKNVPAPMAETEPLFKISLAQWSLHRSIFGADPGERWGWDEFTRILKTDEYSKVLAGQIDPLDFPRIAREDFEIEGVEWVNTFFFDRAKDRGYLSEMKSRTDAHGVRNVLIMCDGEGALGDPDNDRRGEAVTNHRKWVEAAQFLGCHSIRVNAESDPGLQAEEQQKLAADGLRQLCELADPYTIDILVENHGGLSSNAQWLVGVIKMVGHPRIGTLPDFGNFDISETESYDRYQGITELMPYAKSVSAKSYDFDEKGDETSMDFLKIMRLVRDAGYRGFVGIEYEGTRLSEPAGIRATKKLLERVRRELASA